MNKKIKIIEIFNKIANEENLPQRIVYKGVIYNWDNSRYLHYEDKISNEEAFLEGICTEMVLNDYIEILNDEVLEDNTEEIEEYKLENFEQLGYEVGKMSTAIVRGLIKAVNEKEKLTEKEHCCNCGVEITNENRALHNMCNECKYGIDWEEKAK